MKKMVTENLNEFFGNKSEILDKIEKLCRREAAECERILEEFEESIPKEQTDDIEEYHEASGKLTIIAQIMDIMNID